MKKWILLVIMLVFIMLAVIVMKNTEQVVDWLFSIVESFVKSSIM